MDDFSANFDGDFAPFKEILLKFDYNYRKLCKFKIRAVLSQNQQLLLKAKNLKTQLSRYVEDSKNMMKDLKDVGVRERNSYRQSKKLTTVVE